MKNSAYTDLLNKESYSLLLKLIIGNGDIKELQNSLKHNEVVKTLSRGSNYFLDQSYRNKDLVIAKFLLSYGIKFNMKHLAYLVKDVNKAEDHFKYLHDIRPYLSAEQFDLAFSYIVTIHSMPLYKPAKKECYVVEDVLMSLTYTNDESKADLIRKTYIDLYLHSAPIIHDILTAIALHNFKHSSLKVFMPFFDIPAYLNSVTASDNKIYLPMSNLGKKEQGFLMHEFTHYIAEILIKNGAKPFRNGDDEAMKLYHIAIKKSLANIVPLFNKNKDEIITEEMINDETVTLRNVCSKVADVVPLHLFSFYGQPNPKEHNDKLAKVFLNHVGTSDEHNSHFLQHYVDNIVNTYKFDDSTVYSLSRMADLCLRADNELEYEFIAFAVELAAYGASSIVDPLVILFHNDLSIMVNALKTKEGISECLNSIKETDLITPLLGKDSVINSDDLPDL
jgi:hypothetical protein